jgi:glycosyltransferase involved in cell wall biosynthesis
MSEQRKFVCGFYGARDGYELPVALHEAGWLEVLLTDFYGSSGLLAKSGLARAVREHEKLPAEKVRGSLGLAMARRVCGKVFSDPEQRNLWPDALLSGRIMREAAQRNAHIFTFEPYAVPRPTGGFPDGRKQVVFYYHPHVDTEDAIYRDDEKRWPKFHEQSGLLDSPWRRRTADAWKHADLVLCASSFTKQSLIAAGMEERRIAVVPYGTAQPRAELTGARGQVTEAGVCQEAVSPSVSSVFRRSGLSVEKQQTEASLPATSDSPHVTAPLRLLFVGRNPLRKGLHHLLMAWNAAEKQPGDLLTIVCAARPLEMQRLVEGRSDVRWLDSVSGEELDRLYAEADALVVPSLCEGFGHVYLEAMSRGCVVVGTRNSALPDIGNETRGVFTVDVGDVEGLAQVISRASADPSIFRNVREAARQRAGEFTWEKFRAGVREVAARVA